MGIMDLRLKSIAEQFDLKKNILSIEPFGNGHINDTFCITCKTDSGKSRFLLQRINKLVFKNPPLVMENFYRVTEHIKDKLIKNKIPDINRRTLSLIPTLNGSSYYQENNDNFWRLINFIEDAFTIDYIDDPKQAYKAAKSFGLFQKMLLDLPKPRLHETIPDFHNTPKRFKVFEKSLDKDTYNRAKSVENEIEFVLQNKSIVSILTDLANKGEIPEHIIHNDTKINNIMFDKKTGEGICVIDLDTVMPGFTLYDFGDMVRTATCPAAEDEKDLSKIYLNMEMFKAIVDGYICEAREFLNPVESKLLPFSGKLITFEQGIRFLTDYLNNDIYYKIHYKGQNMDRSRTQLKLVQSIIEHENEMNKYVEVKWNSK